MWIIILVIVIILMMNMSESFLNPLPYDSLEPRHYKQMYSSKMDAKCIDERCTKGPGHYKSYPDYYDDRSLLKNYWLGYSVTGFPYNDYKFDKSKSLRMYDVKHPRNVFHYPEWYNYNPRKEAYYIGYPFYFHGQKYL